uniref:Gypsy retrotransposon integrase-like protein 1 n=1 Tax=Scleropages formosus TaxID=113540 RepID=A0A8C9SGK0_SCLFO
MQYRQRENETLDEFVTRARAQAQLCELSEDEMQERIVELVIMSTPMDNFRRELLGKEKGFTLQDMLMEGRKHEAALIGTRQLQTLQEKKIDHIGMKKPCGRCGLHHKPRTCPAYKDVCKGCGKKGHWKKMCRSEKGRECNERRNRPEKRDGRRKKGAKKVDAVGASNDCSKATDDSFESSEDEFAEKFHSIDIHSTEVHTRDEAYTTIKIKYPGCNKSKLMKLKIDPGAQGNALPLRTFRQMYGNIDPTEVLKPTGMTKLTSYSGHSIPCFGKLPMQCKYDTSGWVSTEFHVVDANGPVLLGLPMCTALNLLTFNCRLESLEKAPIKVSTTQDLVKLYPTQFDTIGKLEGPARIILKEDAEPHVDRPRKFNINLKPKIKDELCRMEKLGVIKKVREHTDWCSSMVCSLKKDGSLRLCLDPKRLNEAIKRCPHKTPTLEEVNPEFHGAKWFSKLDAKAGYWSVQLDEQSQALTTFRTPLGLYCFTRLPFDLSISQDIFQQRMDEILEGLEGCVGIADDICVFGKTEEEHDKHLLSLLERAKEKGLVFNSDKCFIKQRRIAFFGNVYSEDGISPDPDKVKDIKNMPSPQDKEDLQRFLGLLTYMGSFIPNLSQKSASLRELLKSETPYDWSEDHQQAYDMLKDAISEHSSMAYFDTTTSVTLEVDASLKGLGVALLQNGRPVAFASKTLTPTQANYSNIEREMLALVHGIQRFHIYLYGRHFYINTDHKPLELICKKPITAPPRLQRMLLRIQGYDFTVTYKPGHLMVLTDTLSRLPNPEDNTTVEVEPTVHAITFDLINFSLVKQNELKVETRQCPILNALAEVVYQGWPEKLTELPSDLRIFWPYRDTIGIDNGILFKGKQVIIPERMRHDILTQLHRSHLGIEKTRLLARDSVYWPSMNKDIERTVKACRFCQEDQDQNRKEPMIKNEVPLKAWQTIGTDLFEIKGRQFIIIADYYSKYPFVKELQSPVTSKSVTNVFKELCGMLGRPDQIRSDNGPQYSATEFTNFCKEWGITHTTSSPHYPQSNGFIERQVRTVKSCIKKCIKARESILQALLNIRATPVDNKLPSPAEMLFGRTIATLLPSRKGDADDNVKHRLMQRNETMKHQYDAHARKDPLPPLYQGQEVRVLDDSTQTWTPGKAITQCPEPRSYVVETSSGASLRRNRRHLREAHPPPSSTTSQSDTPKITDDTIQECPVTKTEVGNHPDVIRTRSGRAVKKPDRYQ